MKIFCIRHGESESNVKGIYNADPKIRYPLTPRGEKQAAQVAEKLKGEQFDAIFSSELMRCQQTAAIINEPHQQSIIIDSRLNERPNGFEGEPWNTPHTLIKEGDDWWNMQFNEGESIATSEKKIHSFLKDLKKQPFQQVLIIGHLDTVRLIAGYVNKLSQDDMWAIKTDNCKINIFEI